MSRTATHKQHTIAQRARAPGSCIMLQTTCKAIDRRSAVQRWRPHLFLYLLLSYTPTALYCNSQPLRRRLPAVTANLPVLRTVIYQ